MSASFQLLIAGSDFTSVCESCRFSHRLGSIGTATITLKDPSASPTVPSDDQAVVIKLGGTTRWSGEVSEVEVTTLTPSAGAYITVTASDNNALAKRVNVNSVYAAQSLKTTLEDLTGVGGVLTNVGVTLSASQANGPTLGAITAPWTNVEALLNHITSLAQYVWRIDASKELRAWAIGDLASGVTLSAANTNVYRAEWRRGRLEYRNSQWVVFGPSEILSVTDTWTGDSTTRTFPLRYTTYGSVPVPPPTVTVTSTGAVILPVGVYGSTGDAELEWWYSSTALSLIQSTGFSVLSSSQGLSATYQSQFPNALNVQNATEIADHGMWERIDTNTDIVDYDEADAWADALIRANITRVKLPRVTCNDVSLLPGYTITVDLSAIDLGSTTCVIQEVSVELVPADGTNVEPFVTLDLAAGSEQQPTTADLWRRVLGGSVSGGGSGSISGGTVTSVSGTPSPVYLGGSRFHAVQTT